MVANFLPADKERLNCLLMYICMVLCQFIAISRAKILMVEVLVMMLYVNVFIVSKHLLTLAVHRYDLCKCNFDMHTYYNIKCMRLHDESTRYGRHTFKICMLAQNFGTSSPYDNVYHRTVAGS